MTRSHLIARLLKIATLALVLVPAGVLAWDVMNGQLSADPVEDITHRTGRWGLTLLVATLGVTPLRHLTGLGALVGLRRTIGLAAFAYLVLHFATYLVLDQFFYVPGIVEDVARRPYITVGFASLLLLVPLAVTSTNGMIRRLGGRRWAALHRLVYVAAAGGVFHFLWLVKADTRDPTIYGGVLVALLGYRLWMWRGRGRRRKGRRARLAEPSGGSEPAGVGASAPG